MNAVSDWLKLEMCEDGWCFDFNGKRYYNTDFEQLSYPEFYDDSEGKLGVIGMYERGVNRRTFEHPMALEISEDCEYARLLREV